MKNALLKQMFEARSSRLLMHRLSILAIPAVCSAAISLSLASCVDDSYDLSKDIDMTMALGTSGLQLKLGNTENILLEDVLEVDDDLKTDASNLYYLVKHGGTTAHFSIDNFSATIDNTQLQPTHEIFNFQSLASELGQTASSFLVPSGTIYPKSGYSSAEAMENMDYHIANIDPGAVHVKSVQLSSNTNTINLYFELDQTKASFRIKTLNSMKIEFPEYLRISNPTRGTVSGNVLTISQMNVNASSVNLGSVKVERIELGDAGKVSADHTVDLTNQEIKMTASMNFEASSQFTVSDGSAVNAVLHVSVGTRGPKQSTIDIVSATGIFDPEINPTLENINVSNSLPSFLEDENVTVGVENPTIKFAVDLSEVPASLDLKAELKANGGTGKSVTIPASGAASATKLATTNIYFSQTGTPYDPAGVETSAASFAVPSLSDLITKIPESITVDATDGRVRVKQTEDYTVTLGTTYQSKIDYDLFVPFQVNKALRIVYTDSIADMNDDLEDYEAEGVIISGDIFSTVPLELLATIEPVDVSGNIIEGITVEQATIAAGNAAGVTTPVEIKATLSNPALLKKLNTLRFRITADGVDGGELTSTQYIRVENLRLKLVGSVVANFN